MPFLKPKIPLEVKDKTSHHPWEKSIKAAYSRTYKYGHNSAKNPIYPPAKEKVPEKYRVKFTVIGNRVTKEFIYCMYLVKGLHKYRQMDFDAPVIRGLTSIEWPKVWTDLKEQFGPEVYCLKTQVAVLLNDKFLGGENELKELVETKYVYHLTLDYHKEGIQQFANYINSTGRPCAYMQVSINGELAGTLIFMLYADIAPRTCKNFLQLCEQTKGGYPGTPVHRIVKDCWMQCGGYGLKNDPTMDCENFIVPHDRRGVLCMANDGRHVDCSTQFFVLLQPAPWMAHKYVAFGQLIEGERTLQKIENVPTWYESPTSDIIILKAGVFNMECHRIPINKNTNAYIHSHIEDLYTIGVIFYEEILVNAFNEIEARELKRLELEAKGEHEGNEQVANATDVREAKRFMHKKEEIDKQAEKQAAKNQPPGTSVSGATENNDFDVDEYEYEFEVFSYKKATVTSSINVKPEKPFYLPLTDVKYPGEVDSTFDLKKLLRGDYCLESDLEKNPDKIKRMRDPIKRIYIPEDVIAGILDTFERPEEMDSDLSINSTDDEDIKKYIRENVDAVSFAGPVVLKMANMQQKLQIFEDLNSVQPRPTLLTDEALRLLRTVSKECKQPNDKKVSISLSATNMSPNKIRRRQTGFVRSRDFALIQKYSKPSDEVVIVDEEDEELYRKVQIENSDTAQYQGPTASHVHMSDTHGHKETDLRQSVLTRLLEDVAADSDDEKPTLKDYKPMSEIHQKHFVLLTNSRIFHTGDSEDKMYIHRHSVNTGNRSIEHVLSLQHGKKVSRKISSDYVRTIDQIEQNKLQNSIRSIEFAKTRPSISVAQYKLKNQKYNEELKAARDNQTAIT